MEQIHTLTDSTLGELRALVAATAHLSDSASVLVRTKVKFNGNGAPITRVHIAEPRS